MKAICMMVCLGLAGMTQSQQYQLPREPIWPYQTIYPRYYTWGQRALPHQQLAPQPVHPHIQGANVAAPLVQPQYTVRYVEQPERVVQPLQPTAQHEALRQQAIPLRAVHPQYIQQPVLHQQVQQPLQQPVEQARQNALGTEETVDQRIPPILSYRSDMSPDGAYSYHFQTADGMMREERGLVNEDGEREVRGSYSYPGPNGATLTVHYLADHGGFRIIPQPNPY